MNRFLCESKVRGLLLTSRGRCLYFTAYKLLQKVKEKNNFAQISNQLRSKSVVDLFYLFVVLEELKAEPAIEQQFTEDES